MARTLRLSFENAFYHITARGIRKENIFHSDRDKEIFLEKMNETFNKYSFICYAYCLMDNHYHLFIQTPYANISKGMHYLNVSYANWFKTKYKLTGSIFQGRYKSMLVDADSYALVLSAYIHLNPVRASIVENAENYPFSSYLDYIGKRKPVVKKLDTSLILSMLSNSEVEAQRRYAQYVEEHKNLKDPLKNSYKNIALGSEGFIEEIKEKINLLKETREISHITQKSKLSYDKTVIMDTILKMLNVKEDDIFKKRKGNIYRQLYMYLLKKYTALQLKEIGQIFGVDYTTVSINAKRFEIRMENDKKLRETVEKVEMELGRNG